LAALLALWAVENVGVPTFKVKLEGYFVWLTKYRTAITSCGKRSG
jgi:hypothetical protein